MTYVSAFSAMVVNLLLDVQVFLAVGIALLTIVYLSLQIYVLYTQKIKRK